MLFWLRFFSLQSQLLSSYGDSWFVLLSGCILKNNTKVLIDETQKRHAKRERQKAQRREQERRRQEELEEREYLRETERQKELMIVEASLSQGSRA